MSKDPRAPQAIILDTDPTPDTASPRTRTRRKAPELVFDETLDHGEIVTVPQTTVPHPPRRTRWLAVLVSALFALFSMWASLAIVQLVESFFARNIWLGWTAFGLAALAGFAALAIITREIVGLMRLSRIEHLQEKAARAINLNERNAGRETCEALASLYAGRPELALGLKQFASHADDIIDPRDRIHLAERLLIEPLDEEAHKIVARRARRVTLLTTVTPIAALDIVFVAAQNLSMLREIATLYGGKPSTLSTLKLARMVATHLAVTGGLALSDNLIQHVVGKGLLGRLSARFGEGAVNGILTSRIGLAACNVCRPVPSEASARETLGGLLREVLTFGDKANPGNETEKS